MRDMHRLFESLRASRAEPFCSTFAGTATRSEAPPPQKWLFSRKIKEIAYYNDAFCFDLPVSADFADVLAALAEMDSKCDVFRIGYEETDGDRPMMVRRDCSQIRVEQYYFDGNRQSSNDQLAALQAELRRSLSVTTGPLMIVALVSGKCWSANRLILIAHHLISDGISIRSVLRFLLSRITEQRHRPSFSISRTGYYEWARLTSQYYADPAIWKTAESYWQRYATVGRDLIEVPSGQYRDARDFRCRVHMNRGSIVKGGQMEQKLAYAVGQGIAHLLKQKQVLIDVTIAGRRSFMPGVDVSSTIGCFSSLSPVIIRKRRERGGANICEFQSEWQEAREHFDEFLPFRYGYAGRDPADLLRQVPTAAVKLNYHGKVAYSPRISGVTPAHDKPSACLNPSTNRAYLFNVEARLDSDDYLRIGLKYDSRQYSDSSIAATLDRVKQELRLM